MLPVSKNVSLTLSMKLAVELNAELAAQVSVEMQSFSSLHLKLKRELDDLRVLKRQHDLHVLMKNITLAFCWCNARFAFRVEMTLAFDLRTAFLRLCL